MTSKHWLRTFGRRTAKLALALSLLISCLSFGAGDPSAQARALEGQKPQVQLRLLSIWESKGNLDPEIAAEVREIREANPSEANLKRRLGHIVEALKLRAEGSSVKPSGDSVALAKDIKRNPLYRDPGLKEQTNWLSGAAARLNNLEAPSCSCNQPDFKTGEAPQLGNWLIPVMWTLLGIAVAIFLAFAFKRFAWSKRLERKAKALLDEDEPERTLDEWLDLADRLEREGRHREAVRCLYLACLLKLDEARVARFERSETNWEHLARIEASSKKPADLDFRSPTRAFDEIWYGMRVNGSEDVARFRAWYRQVTDAVRPRAA